LPRWVRDNGLSLFFFGLFVAALGGQAIAGHDVHNEEASAHGDPNISFGRYIVSSHFGNAVLENWQSEYLQFTLFILATVWLLQRGSPESKELDQAGLESDQKQQVRGYAKPGAPAWAKVDGIRRRLLENSLLIVMGALWVGSWFAQSVTGWSEFNAEQIDHHESTVSWFGYIGTAEFWENTLQNWQSEFLAVASMVVFSIYLRQRGSPESKPVGAHHAATGVEG
jgi:hypothetical protein